MKMDLKVNGAKQYLEGIYTITDMRDKYLIVFKDMNKPHMHISKDNRVEINLHL